MKADVIASIESGAHTEALEAMLVVMTRAVREAWLTREGFTPAQQAALRVRWEQTLEKHATAGTLPESQEDELVDELETKTDEEMTAKLAASGMTPERIEAHFAKIQAILRDAPTEESPEPGPAYKRAKERGGFSAAVFAKDTAGMTEAQRDAYLDKVRATPEERAAVRTRQRN